MFWCEAAASTAVRLLDPLELLSQIRQAQEEIARLEAGADTEPSPAILELDQFVRSLETAWRHGEVRAPYRKRRSDAKPHTWRTRPDPYERSGLFCCDG